MRKHTATNRNGNLTELSKFVLMEMNGNGTFENFLNGNEWKWNSVNGIPFNGILLPFPFADRTNRISPSVKACGSMRQLTETEI